MDLTLATPQGEPLDMGGEIDAVGPIGQPNHFADADPASAEGRYHQRRCILHHAMESAGLVRHPKEWWHFSFRMKARPRNVPYGCFEPSEKDWRPPKGWRTPGYKPAMKWNPRPCKR